MPQAGRSGWLESQYNLARRHPERAERIAQYAAESERVRGRLEARLDVPYGDGPLETLDVFPARDRGSAPVLVFVHGGYWRSLDKRDFSFIAEPFVAAGAAVVLPNYALAPRVTIDTIVGQVRRAVAWTHRNAEGFGGDPSRIVVSGHSAGGHLTATTLLADRAAAGLPADAVKGGCAISGLFDLEPILETSINDDVRLDPASAARNSPLRHLRPGLPPLVVAAGALEPEEFLRQSRVFADAWRAAGAPCDDQVLPGLDHFTVVQELAKADSPLTRALLGLLSPAP
jgi:arylformamidase